MWREVSLESDSFSVFENNEWQQQAATFKFSINSPYVLFKVKDRTIFISTIQVTKIGYSHANLGVVLGKLILS